MAHGARRTEASVIPISEDSHHLPITDAAAEALGLKADVPYRLRWVGGELRLGPVIGLHVAGQTSDIDFSPGSLAYGFLLRYPAVAGLVYLFGTDGIDLPGERIEGFCWLPDEAAPLPDPVGEEWNRACRLAARGQDTAAAEALPSPPHPRVARFRAIRDQFLATEAPSRPCSANDNSAPGRGRFTPGRFPFPSVIWRRHGCLPPEFLERLWAQSGTRLYNSYFLDRKEWRRLLSADPLIGPHLPEEGQGLRLQPCADLPVYRERLLDFRIMMQKDDREEWTAQGIMGCFSQTGSAVTDFTGGGYALPPDEALRRALAIDWSEAYRLKSDLIEFAAGVCEALDRTGGCFGDLGLTVGIGRNRQFWLFEVSQLPCHELPLYMGDRQTYLAVKSGPLLYGAYLSGFGR